MGKSPRHSVILYNRVVCENTPTGLGSESCFLLVESSLKNDSLGSEEEHMNKSFVRVSFHCPPKWRVFYGVEEGRRTIKSPWRGKQFLSYNTNNKEAMFRGLVNIAEDSLQWLKRLP